VKAAIRFGRDIWTEFNADNVMRLASAIAFSVLFAIAPLLIVLIGIVGWILSLQNGAHGHELAESALLERIRQTAGAPAADTVSQLMTATFGRPRQNVIAQIVGWGTFIFGAMGLFSSIQDALNSIWRVEGKEGGWRQGLRDRLASFAMIAIVVILTLASFVASAAIAVAGNHFPDWFSTVLGRPVWVFSLLTSAITLLAGWLAFAAIYRVLPNVRIAWRDVWLGAAVTAVLFLIGERLIGWYLAAAGTASAYGAAGSLLVTLLWIYYSAIAFLLGAEFTKVISRREAHRLLVHPPTIDGVVIQSDSKTS
jgi:membrane protein